MPREYYAILGLAPGRYAPREIARRFQALRTHLDAAPDRAAEDARTQREELYLAYAALRDPRRQAAYLHALRHGTTPMRELRRLIAAALEDDLLRYSRREMLLREGRRLGLSDFQTQLLIAEVQFGGDPVLDDPTAELGPGAADRRAAPLGSVARLAAAGALAVALVVALQRWLVL